MLHTLYRDPFILGHPNIHAIGEGCTLGEIVKRTPGLPRDFGWTGQVTVNGELVFREHWDRIRPKDGTVVAMHAHIGGGDGGGAKQIIGLVAAIALSVVTGGIAAGALAPFLGASFVAGSLGAAVLAGAVGLVGALALSALTAPPSTKPGAEQAQSGLRLEAASVEGNVLEPNTPVPRVIGTRKVFPPFLSEPIVELIGQDEVVEAVYGLAGPHALTDIRLGEASIDLDDDTLKDIEIEVRNGLPGDSSVTLTSRQGRTTEPNATLSVHLVDPENQSQLQAGDSLPVFHAVTTRVAPNENWMHLLLAGLARQTSPVSMCIPLRVRMRRRGDVAWRDLPEIHYRNNTQTQVRLQFKFYWGDPFTDTFPVAPSSIGFTHAWKEVPAQTTDPLGTLFVADSYFSAGAGNNIYRSGTEATTNVRNVVLFPETVEVYLDTTEWEPGIWDIEIKRGATFVSSGLSNTTYVYTGGNVLDFFGRRDSGVMPETREGLLDQLTLTRLVNIWEEHPIAQKNMTLIALTARNRSVNRLSARASGYVLDLPLGRGPLFSKSSGAFGAISFAEAGSPSNVEVLALIRQPEVDTTNPLTPRLMIRGSGAVGTPTFYTFGFRGNPVSAGAQNLILIDRFLGSTSGSTIASATFPWAYDRNFWWRFRAEGSALKAKAWPTTVAEPEDWMLEVTDANITAGGWVGLAFTDNDTIYNLNCNWFSVSGDGGTAPSPTTLVDGATDFSDQTLDVDLSGWTTQFGTITSVVSENANFPYNGNQSDWTELRVTSNPAPHFRDILTGSLNYDPLPVELLEDVGIVSWWRRCAGAGFTCDMVVEGLEVPDLLRVVSSCGYGRLYRSEVFGVIQDFDRSLDSPSQVFSPRNSSGLSWRKAFSRLPAGFRINFREEDLDYGNDQVTVYRSGVEGTSNRLEQVTYDGLVREYDVIQRARFDLEQAERRAAFYTFNAPAESIVCRRGDLIGFNHDVLQSHFGYARIADVIYDEDTITGVVLDAPIEILNEEDVLDTYDILAVEDVLALGTNTGMAIRLTDGTVSTHVVTTESGLTDEIEFETPVPIKYGFNSSFDRHLIHTIAPECLVVTGPVGRELKRLVIAEISPQVNLEAQIVCVDEASEIFTNVFGV